MAREKNLIKPKEYIQMGDIRFTKGIPASVKIFYCELVSMCEDTGEIEVTADYFAQLYKVTNVTVGYWINNLLKRKLISISVSIEGKVRVMKISIN